MKKARRGTGLRLLTAGGGSVEPDVSLEVVVGLVIDRELVPLDLVLVLELLVLLQVADVV